MSRVFIGCPTHDGRIHDGCAKFFYQNNSKEHTVEGAVATFSLITFNCNVLWAVALNRHEAGQADWFAMIHSDVEPEPHWIDKLIAEADRYGADIMTTVIPIKNDTGLSSTAISHPSDDCRAYFRLTMAQLRHPSFPVTFDIAQAVAALRNLPDQLALDPPTPANLLCNTGCMVCRLGANWCDPRKVFFDELTSFERINGQWTPIIRSEDWFFTAKAAQHGAKVMATTSLKVRHHGVSAYPSDQVWGAPRDAEGPAQWGVTLDALSPKRN
jgi:hypothetical protein